jgi:6-O-methylguanine DNA methyltransferase, DNA binding domain
VDESPHTVTLHDWLVTVSQTRRDTLAVHEYSCLTYDSRAIKVSASWDLSFSLRLSHPRQVGVCLKHLPDNRSLRFNNDNVPWQRVINAKGCISPR